MLTTISYSYAWIYYNLLNTLLLMSIWIISSSQLSWSIAINSQTCLLDHIQMHFFSSVVETVSKSLCIKILAVLHLSSIWHCLPFHWPSFWSLQYLTFKISRNFLLLWLLELHSLLRLFNTSLNIASHLHCWILLSWIVPPLIFPLFQSHSLIMFRCYCLFSIMG